MAHVSPTIVNTCLICHSHFQTASFKLMMRKNSQKRNVKVRKKCCSESEIKPDCFVANSGCADDLFAVATLPDDWVPKHSGSLLINYLKEQEQKHGKVLEDFKQEADAVNKNVNSKVRYLAELLLAYITQNQIDIKCIIERYDMSKGPLSAESRNSFLNEAHQLHSQRIEEIERFRREALALERERADGLRTILQKHFQKLVMVGLKPPKDLLQVCDEYIYEINQQLLSNCRAYAELEAQLCAQGEEDLGQLRIAVNQLCLGVPVVQRVRSALPKSREEEQLKRRPTSAPTDKIRDSADTSVSGISRMLNDMEEFEECVSKLVEAYKTALLSVYGGFSGKLSDLHSGLGNNSYINLQFRLSGSTDLQNMIERALHRLSCNVHKNVSASRILLEATRHDALNMQKSLWSLGERLRDTYEILNDAGHVCDAHVMRSAIAQKLIMATVEDLLTSHDTIELASEIPFNIALEQLRNSADQDKLQQQFISVNKILENIADMYMKHSEAEIDKLQKFMSLIPVMSNTLLAEFDCFLNRYPRQNTSTVNMISNQISSSPRPSRASMSSTLPRAILQTELQETALMNWRNGFLESFERNASLVPDELTLQAQLWIDERAAMLQIRYSLKMLSHSIRMERVKAAYEARLSELRHHENRLNSHLTAIQDLMDRLYSEATDILDSNSSQVYPLGKWFERLKSDMDLLLSQDSLDSEVKKLKLKSYSLRLVKHRRLYEESLALLLEERRRIVEHRVQEARISIVRFMSQLKLFTERGQYAIGEAYKTSAALLKAADALDSCVAKVLENFNIRYTQLLKNADEQLATLTKRISETLKPTSKGAKIKKK